jgi:hypothetical protein
MKAMLEPRMAAASTQRPALGSEGSAGAFERIAASSHGDLPITLTYLIYHSDDPNWSLASQPVQVEVSRGGAQVRCRRTRRSHLLAARSPSLCRMLADYRLPSSA